MAKTILGIDVGREQLKMALVRKGHVLKTASASMPENLIKDGHISSRETLSDLIRSTMKDNGIRASQAAFVMPSETVYIKNVEMPLMTEEQLKFNLPFEFNDYITGEVRDYIFDYAVLAVHDKEEEAENPEDDGYFTDMDGMDERLSESMELMVVAAERSVLEDIQDVVKHAGLKLVIAAPVISAYISLIRYQEKILGREEEYCILDLGYGAIRMYMFQGDRHQATRVLEIGLSSVDNVLADAYGVDIHLAHTYLVSNFENCQERAECVAAYENIAVELMRALNFYRFSHPESSLSDLWLCGGGAQIPRLDQTIGDMLDIRLHRAYELVPDGDSIEHCNSYAQAIGITLG